MERVLDTSDSDVPLELPPVNNAHKSNYSPVAPAQKTMSATPYVGHPTASNEGGPILFENGDRQWMHPYMPQSQAAYTLTPEIPNAGFSAPPATVPSQYIDYSHRIHDGLLQPSGPDSVLQVDHAGNVSSSTPAITGTPENRDDELAAGKGTRPTLSPYAKPKNTLPLVVGSRLDQNLVLVQAPVNSFDLSGDVGAVGRVKSDQSNLFLDIKGVLYACGVHDINTTCVVAVGEDEARITSIIDEAVTLHPDKSNHTLGEQLVFGDLHEDEHAEGANMDESSTQEALKSGSVPRKAAHLSKSTKGRGRSGAKSSARGKTRPKAKSRK